MKKKELMIIADYSQEKPLTLAELCEVCGISPDFITDLVQYQIIEVKGVSQEWIFNLQQLQRVKRAMRLQHDLEVNLAGVAIILDLLDELDELRGKVELIEKHYR